ncbi:hypothetical protein Cantr_04017 [Candida viswanathii]|uniref:Protein ecdysoneless n=1 Tax=Candida viswanathii TaxID=5486 RepID=A0A367XP52_9ASCO|nr:hypothetical protein Cantr_04017 [Candida viswanathii]
MSSDYLWTEDELTSFEIEHRFNDTTITFIIVSQDIPTCLTKLLQFLDPWIKSYPWMIQAPTIAQHQTTYNNLTIDYIHGELTYHEYIPESLLLITLLFQFTNHHSDAYIHVFDSVDIEPVLIHCHEFLPNDLQEVGTSIHRVWMHENAVVVLNLHDDRYINMYVALQQLNNADYTRNAALTEYWRLKARMEEYLSNVHDVVIDGLPEDAAKLITNDVNLVSRGLIALEDETRIDRVSVGDGQEGFLVSVVMNTMNLGVVLAICENNPDLTAKDVVVNGLLKYYGALQERPEIPLSVRQVSRYHLQRELINRGLINGYVEENKDAYELFAKSFDEDDVDADEEEGERLASRLHEILNQSKNILDEEDEDPDYEEFSDNEELTSFRNKYYEITNVWLDTDEVTEKYERFKNLMLEQVDNFRLDFKNTEFEDFPEFLETNIMLGLEEEDKKKEINDGECQGDMNHEEYVKFKKKLRKEGEIVDDSDDEDDDWEDVDEEDNNDEDDEDEQVYDPVGTDDEEYAYHQTTPLAGSPKITEIDDLEIGEPQITELSENLKKLQTDSGDNNKPTTLEDILIQKYSKD